MAIKVKMSEEPSHDRSSDESSLLLYATSDSSVTELECVLDMSSQTQKSLLFSRQFFANFRSHLHLVIPR